MKKTLITLIGALCFVAASTTMAVAASKAATNVRAATSNTATDVKTLASAESHVVTVLHNYKATALWKSQFKAAVAQQNTDVAKVSADLTPTAKGTVLFSGSGSGMESTTPFTVPVSAKGWHVNWTYNCASFGMAGNFNFDVYQGTQLNFNDNGPNQLGSKGSGTEHYYDAGTFHLSVSSECAWTVQAVAGS